MYKKIIAITSCLLLLFLMIGCKHNEKEEEDEHAAMHWGYEGEVGPKHWGELNDEYVLCSSGLAQSPIDIAETVPEDLPNIAFDYKPSRLNIINNGHTIQANYAEGSRIEVDSVRYELLQFHFHAPSEHTINAQFSDMELHLVHKSADGNLAVVSVMLNKGAENSAFAPVFDNMPAVVDEENNPDALVNAGDLLPEDGLTYRYIGSLTTPPCSENVRWHVMKTPVQVSEAQVAAFEAIIHDNNRPVQPLNGREVVEDTSPN